MNRYCFLLLLLSYNVYCDNCVVFNFENHYKDFRQQYPLMCIGTSVWDFNKYSSVPMRPPHEKSTSFITPRSSTSCISSPTFSVTAGGTLDVRVYIEPAARSGQVTIMVHRSMGNGLDIMVGSVSLIAMNPFQPRGWQTVKIPLPGWGTFNGFVTLIGVAPRSSVILIDSVRYIGPRYKEELCPIYKQDTEPDTTKTPTTENNPGTTAATTPEPTTDNYITTTSTSDINTTTENYPEITRIIE